MGHLLTLDVPEDVYQSLIQQAEQTGHMESRGLCRRGLEPYLGSRARVAEVLNRKRPLSLEMIRRLYTGLGIAAEILIQPYPLATSAPHKGVQPTPRR
jgi:antitoxin component HigA of HigAB toxin-antitoxin module